MVEKYRHLFRHEFVVIAVDFFRISRQRTKPLKVIAVDNIGYFGLSSAQRAFEVFGVFEFSLFEGHIFVSLCSFRVIIVVNFHGVFQSHMFDFFGIYGCYRLYVTVFRDVFR